MTDAKPAVKKVAVRVVLDTTAIYSDKAGQTLSGYATTAFSKTGDYPQLSIEWCLPEMVVTERQIQIVQQCAGWRDEGGEKMRKALDLEIDLSDGGIRRRVRERIEAEVAKYGILILPLAVDRVDWESIVHDAGERKPPFSRGEEEKGFRDRVIGETFLQAIAQNAPERLVLVTNDDAFRAWVLTKLPADTQARVVQDFGQLDALLKALARKEDEAQAINLQASAATRFFSAPDNTAALFFEWKLTDELRKRYPLDLIITPAGANQRDEKLTISPPEFLKRQGDRFSWLSRVTLEVWHWESGWYSPMTHQTFSPPTGLVGLLSTGPPSNITTTFDTPSTSSVSKPPTNPTGLFLSPPGLRIDREYTLNYRRLVRKLTCDFQIRWSSAERNGEVADPKLDSIEVGTVTREV